MGDNNEVAICTKCRYFNNFDHGCKHIEAPYTDFVHGKKSCHGLNYSGGCKMYEEKQPIANKDVED